MKLLIKTKFPMHKPSFEINTDTQYYSLRLIIHYRDANATITLFMIPKSLEYQVAVLTGRDERYVTCEDVKKTGLKGLMNLLLDYLKSSKS